MHFVMEKLFEIKIEPMCLRKYPVNQYDIWIIILMLV